MVYTTSSETVATVSEDGLVTAVGAGTATITVQIKDTDKKAEMTVTVIAAPEPDDGGEVIYTEGFENDWTYTSTALSTQKVHSGTYSVQLTNNTARVDINNDNLEGNVVSIWVYDTLDKSYGSRVFVGFQNILYYGIGVDYSTALKDVYAYRAGSSWAATSVVRTEGWHKFTYDMSEAGKLKMYVDDTLIITVDDFTLEANQFCILDGVILMQAAPVFAASILTISKLLKLKLHRY